MSQGPAGPRRYVLGLILPLGGEEGRSQEKKEGEEFKRLLLIEKKKDQALHQLGEDFHKKKVFDFRKKGEKVRYFPKSLQLPY